MKLFWPECWREEYKDGEYFKTACEHEHWQNPFSCRRNHFKWAAVAGDSRTKANIGNAWEWAKKGIDERNVEGGEYHASQGNNHHVDAQECDYLVDCFGRYYWVIDAHRANRVGVNRTVELIIGVLEEIEKSVNLGSTACRTCTGSEEHKDEEERDYERSPVLEVAYSQSCGWYCGDNLEERVDCDRWNGVGLSVDGYCYGECNVHAQDYAQIGLQGVVVEQSLEVAGAGFVDQGEVHTSEEHEYRKNDFYVGWVPGGHAVVACRESAGWHGT